MNLRPRRISPLSCLAAITLVAAAPAHAQWSGLPGINNAIIVDTTHPPFEEVAVSDGAGGALFVWRDDRNGSGNWDVFAQRLDANGARVWGDNGVALTNAPTSQENAEILADGTGGAYVMWQDNRAISGVTASRVWVQRLNAAGVAQWEANGQLLRADAKLGSSPGPTRRLLFDDGVGGCYAFTMAEGGSDNTRRLHRLTPAGVVATGWPAAGVDLQMNGWPLDVFTDQPAGSTGAYGVMICMNLFGGSFGARRVDTNGVVGPLLGIPTNFGGNAFHGACSDGAGGMFVITGVNADLFVFRALVGGTLAWPETDKRVVVAGGRAGAVNVHSDAAGGAIVTWYGPAPAPNNANWRMAAQRLSSTGARLWGENGVDVYTPTPGSGYDGSSISDGAGGVIVAYGDITAFEVRAQRLDGNGNKLWPAAGVLIAKPWGETQLVSDQASGAIYSVITSTAGNITFGAKRTTLTGSLGSNSPLARLINISSRAQVGSGDDVLIPGFVVSGGNVELLVRGIGPTLASFNVTGVLADPQLTLFNSTNQSIGTNDDWGAAANAATIASVAQQVQAFALPAGSKDAALLVTLQTGLYTAVMRGAGTSTGVGLVELYEVGGAQNTGRLANMSVRARVGTGDGILIPGIVVGGSDARTLLIRAVGPTLANFNVTGVLADPQLTLFNSASAQVAVNDNWNTPNGAQITTFGAQVSAFPLPANSKDAAFLVTLAPGLYTAQVSGVGNTTGVCLVEVYEIP